MPKVTGPLFSLRAAGKFGKSLIYKNKRGTDIAFKYYKPGSASSYTPSWKQRNQRSIIALLVAQWQSFDEATKAQWNEDAKKAGMRATGYHFWLREAQQNLLHYHGLALYLSFNQASGCVVFDISGNENHGTFMPDCPSNAPEWVDGKTQKYGKAVYLDGADDYIDCGVAEELNLTSAITIEALIKPEPDQEYCWDLEKGNYGVAAKVEGVAGSATWSWQLRYGSADACCLGFQFNEAGAGSKWVTAKQALKVRKWSHIAGTYDGTDIRFYLNGVETDNNTLTGIQGYANKLLVGSEGWANHFNGKVDEFRIYDRALTPGEVLTHARMFTK